MSQTLREIDGRDLSSPAQFLKEVVEPCLPVVMRGLVSGWPVVHAATRSAEDFRDYLARFDNGGRPRRSSASRRSPASTTTPRI